MKIPRIFNDLKEIFKTYRMISYRMPLYRNVITFEINEINCTNANLCRNCGGKCCRNCGCLFSPQDFEEISFEALKREIEKGYISFDILYRKHTYLDFDALVLRTRNIGSPICDTEINIEHKGCVLLTQKGCKLSFEKRPKGGKLYIPVAWTGCAQFYNLDDCAIDWHEYSKILWQLYYHFLDKDLKCVI